MVPWALSSCSQPLPAPSHPLQISASWPVGSLLPTLRLSVYPHPSLENVFLTIFHSLALVTLQISVQKSLLGRPFQFPSVDWTVYLYCTSNSSCELTIHSFLFQAKLLLQGMHSNMGKWRYLCIIIMLCRVSIAFLIPQLIHIFKYL